MGKRRESFEAVQQSVVRVKDADGQTWGTGFFISREGHLLTCAHVIKDAGGWKNVRILDQPVNCLYEGDPERDDFCLLQIEDLQVTPVALGKDFDPGDEFLSFGFSNEDFYGAPIRGEITAFARCGKLGDQKLIRLETFSDAQRIEGGQSGAPALVFQRGKLRVGGIIVASEDLNGGLAISITSVKTKTTKFLSNNQKKATALYAAVGLVAAGAIVSVPWIQTISLDPCKSSEVSQMTATIAESFRNEASDLKNTETLARKLAQKCAYKGYYFEGKALIKQGGYLQSIKAFEESLREKKSPEARFGLAVAYGMNEQHSKAIENLTLLEQDSVFSKEFDPTSNLNERNLKFNIAVAHHRLVSHNYKSSELSELEKQNHLKEALSHYQEVFKQTAGNSCGDNAVGECINQYRAWSSDGLAQVYALLHNIHPSNRGSLNQAIHYLEEGFLAKSQADRQNALNLLQSSSETEFFQKDISYIRSQPEFKKMLQDWQRKLQSTPQ